MKRTTASRRIRFASEKRNVMGAPFEQAAGVEGSCTQFSDPSLREQNEMKCNQTKYFDLRQVNSVVYRVGK
jgi:hypothetical protein